MTATRVKFMPKNGYGWASLGTGLAGSLLYLTQFFLNWYGQDDADRTLFSVIVLLLLCAACVAAYVSNNREKLPDPRKAFFKYFILSFVIVLIVIVVMSGTSMTMDMNFKAYAEGRMGFFTGLKFLTQVTSEDVNSLSNWGLGIQTIIKSLFLIVPFLIGTWGGLSVLTADSIDEAEGGIMAIVAAFIVVIVVFLFKLVGVILG